LGALDLVRHRLAHVVEKRGALRRLDARPELRRHHAGEVGALEGVLEDVLTVARAVAEAAQHLHELLVHLAAVRLEDRLLPSLPDEVLDLRLRAVVHLLDAGRMDAPVLDELRQRQLGHLPTDAVERGEHDRLRSVVDDEVHAREVLEGADVAALPADDPALHVVGRELDDRDRRLGGVARGDPLEGVGDEVPCAALGVGVRLLLELSHHAAEVVADELLRALEHLRLRLLHGQPGDALQLLELVVLGRLGLLLELLQVRLPVQDPLLAPLDLGELAVDLLLLGDHPLLDLGLQLLLDVGAELERLLARLDLGLTADRVGRPRRVGGRPLRLGDRGRHAPRHQDARPDETAHQQTHGDPEDQEEDGSSHCWLLRCRARRNGGFGESAPRRRASERTRSPLECSLPPGC
jgi:hypothetical protein